ncbi:MAG: PAS domain S-box protein, partial [Candidatus Methylomirabilaceae bacterium]
MEEGDIKILVVEDNEEHTRLLREVLAEAKDFPFEMEVADRLSTGLKRLGIGNIDLILLDLGLPDSQGLATLGRVRAAAPRLPIVVLTAIDDEGLAVQAVQRGAQDYLVKGQVDSRSLTRAIRYAIERKRAEETLRESEERFRLLADTAPVLIWMSGPDTLCTYFNRGWLEFTGRTLEQEMGDGWVEGVHPEDVERCLDTYRSAFDARRSFRMEYRMRRADGEYRWILDEGVPRMTAAGSFAGYVGSAIDITEHRQVEETLRESEEKFRSIVETTAEWIWSIDREGRMTYNNPAVQAILGYSPEELLGKDYFSLMHEEDRAKVMEILPQWIVQKSGWMGYPIRWRRKDGSYRYLESNAVPMINAVGELVGYRGADRDITERNRMDETLRALYQASLQIQEPVGLQERLDRLLQIARTVLELDRVNILLAGRDGQWLQAVASLGTREPVEVLRVPIGPAGGGIAQAYRTQQVVTWDGTGILPEELRLKPPYDRIEAFRSRVFANVPLVVQGRAIGV